MFHRSLAGYWSIKIKVSGRLSGESRLRVPVWGLRVLVSARVLPGQALYLRQRNHEVIHGKEKVGGSIPPGGSTEGP
jgi:hypothetical protein